MQKLITWFSENSIAANLLTLAILLSGLLSLNHINKEFFPNADVDTVQINIPYPGAAPINVEEQICIRIEQAVDGLDGIKKITAYAKHNLCQVNVEATDSYDVKALLSDIKNRVDAITGLPEDSEKAQVLELNKSFEMVQLALTGSTSEKNLKRFAQKIKRDLETLPNVSTVTIEGTRDYEIGIEVSQQTLQRFQLSFNEIQNAIRQNSLDLPIGTLKTAQGNTSIQARHLAEDAQSLGNIIIRKNADGSMLYLKDIAEITDGFVETAQVARYNQKPAVFFKVQVTSNPDVIKTHDTVSQYLAKTNPELPGDLELTIWYSFYDSFVDRINLLVKNGIGGLLLVFIVLMLFLRPLLALWVSIGIGIAFLGTLWLMPLVGASLNMISLFAFLMILGIVVDDAIIVGEQIYEQQQRHGITLQSVQIGTLQVYKPVLYAVLSTMLVFLPMLFLPGESAKSSQAIPTVVLLTLGFSLIESLLILPSHLVDMPPEGHFKNPISRGFDKIRAWFSNRLEQFVNRIYQPILKLSLNHYGSAIASFFVAIIISLAIFAGGWLSFSFLPKVDTDHIMATIELPEGEPDAVVQNIALRVEKAAQTVQQNSPFKGTDISHIKNIYVRAGASTVFVAMGLNRDHKQSISSPELIQRWRKAIGPIPQAHNIEFQHKIASRGKDLQFQLASENNQSLAIASTELQQYIRQFSGVYNVSDSLQAPRSEIEMSLNEASQFNFWDIEQLSQQVRAAFYGTEVQRIARDKEEIRIMLRLSEQERANNKSLESLPIYDRQQQLTRLGSVTEIQFVPALQEIQRIDRKRTVIVGADLLPNTSDSAEISNAVMSEFLPQLKQEHPEVDVFLEGEEQERREFMSAWLLFFFQALLAIYAMMAIAFRSYWQPAIILTAIPFGLMGAIFGHLIMGKDISIFSFLGVMACAGVVVNDNLVLIDRINQLREQGGRLKDALLQAGRDRFRPIILTSVTTFIGLMPIMSETSLQAQFLIPMVISLAFGVLFATTITLILVPCLYLMGDRAKQRLGGFVSHKKQKRAS